MPIKLRRRRPAVKRMVKKRSIPRPPRTGGTVITRRLNTQYIANSSFYGSAVTTNTGLAVALVTLGTPVVHPYFGNNFTVPFSLQFSLDQLAEYTDFTNICDRYKILDVYVKLQYNTDSVAGAPNASGQPNMVPSVNWIQDYDDSNVLTATQLNAKMGIKRKALNDGRFHSISVKPRLAATAFQGGAVSAYTVPGKATWVNSAYPSVPHYGIKGFIENMYLGAIATGTACIAVDVTFKIAIKVLQ